MWAGHHAHHSSEDYNLMTALRQGVLQKYSSWVFYLPMAFFIPASMFVVHIQFSLLYQFWIHTATVGKIGPLEYILNTPSHHRVHHGVNRYCIDKNFGGVLIIWDRIFGTFELEQKTDDIVYGVVDQVHSWNPTYIQACKWIHVLKTISGTEGVANKFSVLVKGPGWMPGKPRLGVIEDIPDMRAPVEKYDVKVSTSLSVYCWLQFGLTLILYEALVPLLNELTVTVRWLAFLYMLSALVNIGFIFESRWFAPYSHLVQLTVYLATDFYVCSGGYTGASTFDCPALLYHVKIGVICSVVITSLWIIRLQCQRKLSAKIN